MSREEVNGVMRLERDDGTIREEFCQQDEFGRWVCIILILDTKKDKEGHRRIYAMSATEPEVRA